MKRLFVLILVICQLSFLSVAGQGSIDFDRVRFGVQASPVFSFMYANDNQINSDGLRLGMKLGLMAEYYFAENYAITSGFHMSFNHGGPLSHDLGGTLLPESELSSEDFRTLGPGATINYGLQYIELPIALKMRTNEYGYLRYYAELPIFHLGILTRARGDITAPGLSTEKENISKDVTFLNMSWGFGGGVEYSVSPETSLVGGLYYHQSFIDVTDDDGVKSNGDEEDSKGSFGLIQLRLGVLF